MFNWFKRKPPVRTTRTRTKAGLFSTDAGDPGARGRLAGLPLPNPLPNFATPGRLTQDGGTMDSNDAEDSLKPAYGNGSVGIPENQLMWYASQGFIGYQMCALLAQHWMIDKACTMPAKDAVRKGYEITSNDGTDIDPKVMDYIKELDEDRFNVNFNLIEFLRFGRIFGIRIVKFVVESNDPEYYLKPFNLDGIEPYSYKGMAQIDPYWITPQLTSDATLRPGSIHFYEPEFWSINGEPIHRSHLIIYRTNQVADVLKPTYFYGGVSVPQRIYERVYAAERSANEAPMLAMTKRLTVLKTDLAEAIADQAKFDKRMLWWTEARDNYGVKINGLDDAIEQFDTTLTGFDALIMSQYQIVAMIAEVPGTKLLGTQPKGFNSTGEFEESSYHEFLESLQADDLARLLRRHHAIMLRSHVNPKMNTSLDKVLAKWNPLDAMTAQESVGVQLSKAQVGATLIASGVIDAEEERGRLIVDPDSGYNGLSDKPPEMPDAVDAMGNPIEVSKNLGAPKPRQVPTPKIAGS